jgi:hypothetical protein
MEKGYSPIDVVIEGLARATTVAQAIPLVMAKISTLDQEHQDTLITSFSKLIDLTKQLNEGE